MRVRQQHVATNARMFATALSAGSVAVSGPEPDVSADVAVAIALLAIASTGRPVWFSWAGSPLA